MSGALGLFKGRKTYATFVKKREKIPFEVSLIFTSFLIITWTFWPSHFDAFIFSKFLLLLISGAWTLGGLVSNYQSLVVKPLYPILLLLFVAWFTFLALQNNVIHTSLFGVQGRNMGLLSYLALVVFSLFAMSCSQEIVLDRVIQIFTITSAGIVFYGLLQILKLDPWDWKVVYQGIIGNLGNPNFMSVTGALFGVVTVYWGLRALGKTSFLILSLVGLVCAFHVIYYSRSTQGWLVFLIGITPLAYLKIKEFGKSIGLLFLYIVSGSSVLVGLAIFNIGPLSTLIYQESLAYRADFWRIAWRMAVDKPLFGVGIDRYQNYYREYKTLEQVTAVGAEDFSDSAHNLYLHFAATGGFPFAILLLLINLFVGYRFLLALRSKTSFEFSIALVFGLWLGIQSQSLISVDYPSIALWGWVFGGFGVGMSYPHLLDTRPKNNSLALKYSGSFISISSTALAIFVLLPASSAQSELRTGFYAYVEKGDQEAIQIKSDFLKRMETKDPGNPTLPMLSANSLYQDEAYLEAADASRRAIKIDRHDYRSWWFLASSLEELDRRKEALTARQKTIELSPFNVANLLELGKDQIAAGDIVGAKKTLGLVAELSPNSAEFQELSTLISNN